MRLSFYLTRRNSHGRSSRASPIPDGCHRFAAGHPYIRKPMGADRIDLTDNGRIGPRAGRYAAGCGARPKKAVLRSIPLAPFRSVKNQLLFRRHSHGWNPSSAPSSAALMPVRIPARSGQTSEASSGSARCRNQDCNVAKYRLSSRIPTRWETLPCRLAKSSHASFPPLWPRE